MTELAKRADIVIGDLRVSPARRRVEGPDGIRKIEPQFMLVFLRLLEASGRVVTRGELFDECWGGLAVGDDSLNRAISGARRIAAGVGSSAVMIETIPRLGYMLTIATAAQVAEADNSATTAEVGLQGGVEEAYDCWRLGLPSPDEAAIQVLRSALSPDCRDATAWGTYALLLRKAAEYAGSDKCAAFVRECERAARKALTLVGNQPDARVALAGVMPICGNWQATREVLLEVLRTEQGHVPALHDLAVVEMATGRPSAARPIIEDLIARDPLAATFYYKRMYHLWTFDELAELDLVAARALQLWPRHPAIWSSRLWTFLFTHRAEHALGFLEDETVRPPIAGQPLDLILLTVRLAAAEQLGEKLESGARRVVVARASEAARRGPAQAVVALFCLCAVNAINEAFEVAYGYYLAKGAAVTPLRHTPGDLSITDQHRRVTQPLFVPSALRLRQDCRFVPLCEQLGLTAYWDRFGLTPDFLRTGDPAAD